MYISFDSEKVQKEISVILNDAFPAGQFTAQDVVDYARPKASPLHKYFEWDDTKAADQYRLDQARRVIQLVVIRVGDSEVREFQNVFVKEEDRRMYVRTDKAQRSTDLWQQVLDAALNEANAWARRYETLSQLSTVVKAIKTATRRYHGKTKESSNSKGRKGRGAAHNDSGSRAKGGKDNAGRRKSVTR